MGYFRLGVGMDFFFFSACHIIRGTRRLLLLYVRYGTFLYCKVDAKFSHQVYIPTLLTAFFFFSFFLSARSLPDQTCDVTGISIVCRSRPWT